MKSVFNCEVLTSAARTTDPTITDLDGDILRNAYAIDIIVDVSDISVTPTITLTISATDEISANTYPLLVSSGITTVSTNVLRIGLGLTESANAVANYPVPDKLSFGMVHTDSDSITYSIGAKIYKDT